MKRLVLASLSLGLVLGFAPSAFADNEPVLVEQSAASVSGVLPAWRPDGATAIRFKVLRKGRPFGQHTTSFVPNGAGGFTATNDIDLIAKIGPITAYRYTHDSVERWNADGLVGFESTTRKEGNDLEARAERKNGKLFVEGTNYTGTYDAAILPVNHWNIRQLDSDGMLSTEGGQLIPNEAENLGRETLTIAGEPVEATKFKLKSELTIFLWYDDQGRWVKLSFDARGQTIDYVLEELY